MKKQYIEICYDNWYNTFWEGIYMLDGKSLGAKLKKLRERSSITQSQIAEYLKVDQSYVSKLESGQRQISMLQVEKLSHLFGLPVESLLEADVSCEQIPFAMRAKQLEPEDLESIAVINRIALNLKDMQELAEVYLKHA
jgi:transcriptional regulator with XRE-family HTH domain